MGDFTTARGRLRPSLRPMPMPMLTTGPMAMDWAATMVATTDLATGPMVTDMVSPPSALPTPPSPLLLEATLVPGATSPTPLEPSMLPRGRLRLSLSRTTTEDMGMATDSDTGPTDMVSTDTAAVTTTVKFCLDVLDLDATMLPTFCP